MDKTILYIHGMGGGGDSRIPSILSEHIDGITVRTYSFDPETAGKEIAGWVEELSPALIIGESLGSLHAIAIKGIPHILVSPALNAPVYFGAFAFMTEIPGVTLLLDRIYRPREGDRQKIHFTCRTMLKYPELRRKALANSPASGSRDRFFAFFGTRDHYRRSGIVSIRTYRRYFGDSFSMYRGSHFMEEEFVRTILVDKIREFLQQDFRQ